MAIHKSVVNEQDLPKIAVDGVDVAMSHAGQVVKGKLMSYSVNMEVDPIQPSKMRFEMTVLVDELTSGNTKSNKDLADQLVRMLQEI